MSCEFLSLDRRCCRCSERRDGDARSGLDVADDDVDADDVRYFSGSAASLPVDGDWSLSFVEVTPAFAWGERGGWEVSEVVPDVELRVKNSLSAGSSEEVVEIIAESGSSRNACCGCNSFGLEYSIYKTETCEAIIGRVVAGRRSVVD